MNSQKKKNQVAKEEKVSTKAAPGASMLQNLETEEDTQATLAGANNKTFLGVDAILYPKDGKIGQAPAKKAQQRGKKSKV